jgi:deazaflavin-dependent oxidoreductase (nitroreductase family)
MNTTEQGPNQGERRPVNAERTNDEEVRVQGVSTIQKRPAYLGPTNAAFKALTRMGIRVGPVKILTVPGRTSGKPRSTPISLVPLDGRRCIVVPMPQGDWARNARAAGRAQLSDGRRTEPVRLRELDHAGEADLRRRVLVAFPAAVPHGVRMLKALGLVTSAEPAEFAAAADQVSAFEVLPASTSSQADHPAGETMLSGVTATEVVLPGRVEPDGFQLRRRELPAPARGEVLVTVEATGISFAEYAMRIGRYPGQPKFPFVPGYDLVGTVTATGVGVNDDLVGKRVAAVTKTGGWATHVLLKAVDVVLVPAELDPGEVETLVVSGLTAYQMLHRRAKVSAGQTVLIHGANGGVGTTLVQLALNAGVRVIGTSSPRHHAALRELGVLPVDYNDPDLAARVRELAPTGVDAVFDHIGGKSIARSWSLLAKNGTLVSYAMLKDSGPMIPAFLALLVQLAWLNVLPNGRRAGFYDVWAGKLTRPNRFRARLRRDLSTVFALLAEGTLRPQIAARVPLAQIQQAVELAESHTVVGKVVLLPGLH